MAIRKRNNPRVFARKYPDNPSTSSRLKTLASEDASHESTNRDERLESTRYAHQIDCKMGFERYEGGQKQRVGWLINMHTTMLVDDERGGGQKSAVDFYFLDEEGGGFKATLQYNPYFLVACKSGMEVEVEEYLRRRYEDLIANVVRLQKEDLRMVSSTPFDGD
jgi:DNA polymerase epsilon subunit 1